MRLKVTAAFLVTPDGKEEQVRGDYILNATGRSPVRKNLGLAKLKVDFHRKGIRTDEFADQCPGRLGLR